MPGAGAHPGRPDHARTKGGEPTERKLRRTAPPARADVAKLAQARKRAALPAGRRVVSGQAAGLHAGTDRGRAQRAGPPRGDVVAVEGLVDEFGDDGSGGLASGVVCWVSSSSLLPLHGDLTAT